MWEGDIQVTKQARKKERKKENQSRQFILIHMTTNP
jgi:hypothetical protein